MRDRLSDGSDAGRDEIDAGKELLAVVVLASLRDQSTSSRNDLLDAACRKMTVPMFGRS